MPFQTCKSCYITPAFSGIPNKEDKIKAQKKTEKNKKRKFSMIPPRVLQIAPAVV